MQSNKSLLNLFLNNVIIPSIGDLLGMLGRDCPQIKHFSFTRSSIWTDITESQIETFTRGCQQLVSLTLQFPNLPMVPKLHKLLYCLGSHNRYLEKLDIESTNVLEEPTDLPTSITESLRCLLNGCPLLWELSVNNISLSTQAIIYIANNSIHLQTLSLNSCYVFDDTLVFTKEMDKLKYLKKLDLSFNDSLTDKNFINLIEGCHDVKEIRILDCRELTNDSLFSIAKNCPQLEYIELDFYENGSVITIAGLRELLLKCPNLIKIGSDDLPDEIELELEYRKR